MPALYRITDQQVLSSAGLDAYVFLAFFKMSMRLFAVMFFLAAVVLEPINHHFLSKTDSTHHFLEDPTAPGDDDGDGDDSFDRAKGYLWSYLIFTYVFTGLTLYFLDRETTKVIGVRQNYLGTQSTVTDRTFRLSGIPRDLRTEAAIKHLVQKLEIGRVESVTLCRDWKNLDALMEERKKVLDKLEVSWSLYLAHRPEQPAGGLPRARSNGSEAGSGLVDALGDADEEAGESDRLLRGDETPALGRRRPQIRFWYGFLRLQSRKTDAIDYYTEKLRQMDEKIHAARRKTHEPADLAFVTMDSIAACQMAIQALIDPHPGRLLTKPAPAPSDVVWKNTYAPRLARRIRSWTVTIFVTTLSIVWVVPVAFLASVLSICTINQYLPAFGDWLKEHEIARALIQTGLPTLIVSLLNIAAPYVYDYLSAHQGMISQGDVALSVISKNFFFTFFNIFLMFTVFGAVTSILDVLRNSLKDTTYIAYTLARKITDLSVFYTNFIMLQGLGLFPFRLLEFGSVAQYPLLRAAARTPRDRANLVQPPMFHYGFYLPTALLVFILCLVYSALPDGYLVLGLGLAYFSLGYFTYKYQLLYAMDQPQHATGGAWRMICYRVVLGLAVCHVTMSGYLALRKAFTVALLVTPLFIATLWFAWNFRERVEPLTRFISLRSIQGGAARVESAVEDGEDSVIAGAGALLRRGSTVDEDREKGLRFVNPSLVQPYVPPPPLPHTPFFSLFSLSSLTLRRLEQPWIYQDAPPPLVESDIDDIPGLIQGLGRGSGSSSNNHSPPGGGYETPPLLRGAETASNASSTVSLGDTHIWRE